MVKDYDLEKSDNKDSTSESRVQVRRQFALTPIPFRISVRPHCERISDSDLSASHVLIVRILMSKYRTFLLQSFPPTKSLKHRLSVY